MENHQIDSSQIYLQENIPLSEEEIKEMEQVHQVIIRVVAITIVVSMAIMGLIGAFAVKRETLQELGCEDYFAFLCIGVLFFGFCYFFAWLCAQYFRYKWRKDKLNGKNKLTSIVIYRDKTEHAGYLTFSGPLKNEKIRIEVKPGDYYRYKIGSKVIVTYLKFTKKALEITDLCNNRA